MDILRSLRYTGEQGAIDSAKLANSIDAIARPQTITEMLDSQIKFYEKKIADLKEAKEAVSPDVERALNALAKL